MTEAKPSYLDEAKRPKLHTSIAGFIDMLGFSQLSTTIGNTDEAQRLLEKIVEAIDDSRRFVRESVGPEEGAAAAGRWAIKYFSDNLVIGYPLDASDGDFTQALRFVVRCVQQYQLRMALNGFFLRGALTHGSLCVTDDVIFGPALIEAYQLESKTAIVPRVVLTETLRRTAMATCSTIPSDDDAVCRDVDGWWFVNYLDAARNAAGIDWQCIRAHKRSVLASLSSTHRHDVLPKFGWACRYHNVFCHWHRSDPGYTDDCHIDRLDEQSTIYRPSDLANEKS